MSQEDEGALKIMEESQRSKWMVAIKLLYFVRMINKNLICQIIAQWLKRAFVALETILLWS